MRLSDLFGGAHADLTTFPDPPTDLPAEAPGTTRTVVLGGGCFWCTEAVFLPLDGVTGVISGYAGGAAGTANYQAVCSGTTGHAEVIQVTFEPARISYGQILKVFFSVAHDPTQLNRQGADRGTQYRSAIFVADDAERAVAEAYIAHLNAAKAFPARIATTVEPLDAFYPAEAYHQNFAARNPGQPYVEAVALPKVEKLRHYYGDRLKPGV